MRTNRIIIPFLALLLALLAGGLWLSSGQFTVGRASVTVQDVSVDNSYVFVTPIRAKANNDEKMRITVFVLNNQGIGVLGKKVILSTHKNLVIDQVQAVTDTFGKAIFDVSTGTAGEYYLDVRIDTQLLPQKAHLSFY